MIISKGMGILLVVVGAASLLLMELVTKWLFQDDSYYQEQAWPMAVAVLITAAVMWPLGRWLNRNPRRLLDADTGEEVEVDGEHSFYFIKLQYLGPVLAVIGLLALFG